MNFEIKVPLSGFLVKWLEHNFGPQPFNFSENTHLSKEIRFIFTGKKNHNKGNFSEKTNKVEARFILTQRQSASFKKYQSTTELSTAVINHFTSHLSSFVETGVKSGQMRMMEAIRTFIFAHDLDGEDLTLDYCKKRVQEYRKSKKKYITINTETLPGNIPYIRT